MDDHPEAELRLKRRLKEMNLYAADTKGDGNCLFRALSDQLYGDAAHHYRLRQELCDYIEANPDRFRNYIEGSEVGSYVRNMRQDHVYGGDKEISAFAFAKQKVVKIIVGGDDFNIQDDIQDGGWTRREREKKERQRQRDQSKVPVGATGAPLTAREQRRIKRGKEQDREEGKAVQAGPSRLPDGSIVEAFGPVCLAYHKWEHYSSVRKISGPHTGLPRLTEGSNDIFGSAKRGGKGAEEAINLDSDQDEEAEEAEATDGEKLLIEHLQEPIPLRTARFYIQQNEGDWRKALEALEALQIASSPEGSGGSSSSSGADRRSEEHSEGERDREEEEGEEIIDDDETDYEPDEAIRSRPVHSPDEEAFQAHNHAYIRQGLRRRSHSGQSMDAGEEQPRSSTASTSSLEAEAVVDALETDPGRSRSVVAESVDQIDGIMAVDDGDMYYGSNSVGHEGRRGGLPDHLRDWRAASPASVDTVGTHSSADGGSTSTRATTDEAHEEGQTSTASTAKSPSSITDAADDINKSDAAAAAKRGKRPASKDPLSLRSPKRRSRSRSPAEMPHDDGETTSAARAIANIRVASSNSTPLHFASSRTEQEAPLSFSSSSPTAAMSTAYGLRSKAASASGSESQEAVTPSETSQTPAQNLLQEQVIPVLPRKRGPGRPRKDGLPPGSLKVANATMPGTAPSPAN